MDTIVLRAISEGEVNIAGSLIPCAVLEDGTRVLNQGQFLQAIGRSRTPKGRSKGVDEPAPFLEAKNLQPFIDAELRASTIPVRYARMKGGSAIGFRAELLPSVCEVILRARREGVLSPTQKHIAERCEILLGGLARLGIIALVDEATGYQYERERDALEQILNKYIAKELSRWVKRFPDDYYRHMIRLWGWTPRKFINRLPPIAGKITNDLVYARLERGVLKKLQELNPKDGKGRRVAKHHQWLTEDFGVPELREHLIGLVALMRASTTKAAFLKAVDRAFPAPNTTLLLPLEEPSSGEEDAGLALPGVKPRDAIKAFMEVDPKKTK